MLINVSFFMAFSKVYNETFRNTISQYMCILLKKGYFSNNTQLHKCPGTLSIADTTSRTFNKMQISHLPLFMQALKERLSRSIVPRPVQPAGNAGNAGGIDKKSQTCAHCCRLPNGSGFMQMRFYGRPERVPKPPPRTVCIRRICCDCIQTARHLHLQPRLVVLVKTFACGTNKIRLSCNNYNLNDIITSNHLSRLNRDRYAHACMHAANKVSRRPEHSSRARCARMKSAR